MSNFFSYQFVYERNKELKIHNNQNSKTIFLQTTKVAFLYIKTYMSAALGNEFNIAKVFLNC